MLPSPAVTRYVTGEAKLLAVVPLICSALPAATLAPVVANVAIRAVTSVPEGTVAAIALPLIVARTSARSPGLLADRKPNSRMAFDDRGTIVTRTV